MSMATKYAMNKRRHMFEGSQPEGRRAYAEGGDVDCRACKGGMCMEHGGEVGSDMVDNIMRKRMAKGGEVTDHPDDESADFDYLDTHPAPDDADYTGANSGDHLGDEKLEEDEHDLIARIMRSRAKKDRLPRPA